MDKDNISQKLSGASKDAYERNNTIHKTPVTRKELDERIKQRARPVFEYHLRPDGSTEREINSRIEADNERRIHFIQKRLNRMQDKVRQDFNRSSSPNLNHNRE